MAYASQSGRARTSARNPQAHAICDRCGFRYNMINLSWQWDWRGASKQNLRILVCSPCNDKAQEQLRAIVLPADPMPIVNARVESFSLDETDFLSTSAPPVYDAQTGIPIPQSVNLTAEDGTFLTDDPIGPPAGLQQGVVMPLNNGKAFGIVLPVMSVMSDGSATITVTCSAVHGMSTNDQISVAGLSNTAAVGFYSVTVTTATAFTYQTLNPVRAASLLTSTSRIITALVGLPYDYTQIPQTGA